jgi:hypothetical protein
MANGLERGPTGAMSDRVRMVETRMKEGAVMAGTQKRSGGSKRGKAEGDGRILINFILDKSGSMDVVREATISGFNEFKNDQTAEAGEALFSLTMFDTRFVKACSAVPIREVPDLDYASYRPGGTTALYDAVASTILETDEQLAVMKDKPEQVLFVIMTDGLENSSREFTRAQVFNMIDERIEKSDYEFIYLGANQDSYEAGREIGVRDGHMLDYDGDVAGVAESMARVSRNVRGYRRQAAPQSEAWFGEGLEVAGANPGEDARPSWKGSRRAGR